jgi:hypothetical protein
MSKTKKTQTKPKTTRKLGQPMKGCEILVAALEREGVDSIFAYPGGASMELHQALTSPLRFVRTCHGTNKAARLPRAVTGAPRARRACVWPPAGRAQQIW